jgi:hypothetical protein
MAAGHLNNVVSSSIGKTLHETAYGFTPLQTSDLLKPSADDESSEAARTRDQVADSIAFAQMDSKYHYDKKHLPMFLKVDDYALLRLHRGYNIPSIKCLGPKLSQQYVGPFRVKEKVGPLAYKLNLPLRWRIHPVFTIAQLEPCPAPESDSFQRIRPDHPDSVFVEIPTKSNPLWLLVLSTNGLPSAAWNIF